MGVLILALRYLNIVNHLMQLQENNSSFRHSEITKIGISEMKKGKISSFFGKNYSEETKTKISECSARKKVKYSGQQLVHQ